MAVWPIAAPTPVHAIGGGGYKELDMSLPNYSDVKSPKASVETVKSLYVDKSPPSKGASASSEKMPDFFAVLGGVVGGDKKKQPKEKKEKTDAQGYVIL